MKLPKVVVFDKLPAGLVDRPLHGFAQVGLWLVYGVPLSAARGEHVQI